jgi:hypothetical protein
MAMACACISSKTSGRDTVSSLTELASTIWRDTLETESTFILWEMKTKKRESSKESSEEESSTSTYGPATRMCRAIYGRQGLVLICRSVSSVAICRAFLSLAFLYLLFWPIK